MVEVVDSYEKVLRTGVVFPKERLSVWRRCAVRVRGRASSWLLARNHDSIFCRHSLQK